MTNPVQSGDLGALRATRFVPTCAMVLIAALLAGCEPEADRIPVLAKQHPEEPPAPNEPVLYYGSAMNTIEVWKDPETGCEYLAFDGSYSGGLVPRLGPDGLPKCPKATGETK